MNFSMSRKRNIFSCIQCIDLVFCKFLILNMMNEESLIMSMKNCENFNIIILKICHFFSFNAIFI